MSTQSTFRRSERLDAIARLFRYPDDHYASTASALTEQLKKEQSRAAAPMCDFIAYTVNASQHGLEETYTRTFDLNPSCSPEIGWHLFGEEYVRGLFMVQMRSEMRERGLEETGELPDHLVHVLAILGAMDEEPAREMARACLCPAIGKMLRSFDGHESSAKVARKKERELLPRGISHRGQPPPSAGEDAVTAWEEHPAEQPFQPLVVALAELVLEEFDLPTSALEAKEEDHNSLSASDPLHSMPCDACGGAHAASIPGLDLHQIEPGSAASLRDDEENHP